MLIYSKYINPIAKDDDFEKVDAEDKPVSASAPAVSSSSESEILLLKS